MDKSEHIKSLEIKTILDIQLGFVEIESIIYDPTVRGYKHLPNRSDDFKIKGWGIISVDEFDDCTRWLFYDEDGYPYPGGELLLWHSPGLFDPRITGDYCDPEVAVMMGEWYS